MTRNIGITLMLAWLSGIATPLCAEGFTESAQQIIELDSETLNGAHVQPETNVSGSLKSQSIWLGQFCAGMAYVGEEFSIPSEGYPADEYLIVKNGWLHLTDANGTEHRFEKGQRAFIPKGWQGTWTNSDDYLEFVVTSSEFCPDQQRAPWPPNAKINKDAIVFDIETTKNLSVLCDTASLNTRASLTCARSESDLAYNHILALEWQQGDKGETFSLGANNSDTYVEVINGSITFSENSQKTRIFAKGDAFVVTRYFKGSVKTSSEFEAMIITGKDI